MTTFADLIEESRHHLMTAQPDRLNVLNTTIDSDDDTVTLKYANRGIGEGTRLCIDLEEFHVISTTSVGDLTTATILRGMAGSTPAAHVANAKVYVNPQFSDFRIAKYVNQGFDDLSAQGLFQIKDAEFTYLAGRIGYELIATDLIDIWRVRYQTLGSNINWPVIQQHMWELDNNANLVDFPSGKQLLLREGGMPGQLVRVSYRAGFDPLVALADNVTVSGLHPEAWDLPSLYAAMCLLAGRDVKRTFLNRQPEPRRQEEVPPGAASQSMRPLVERYYSRIDREKVRLQKMYPRGI